MARRTCPAGLFGYYSSQQGTLMNKSTAIVICSLLGAFYLAGCTSSGVSGVPREAVLIQEGRSNVHYTAGKTGTVIVRDQPADRIIYQGPIAAGQELIVDAKTNRLTLNNRPLDASAPLRTDATYQIYFRPEEHHEYHPMMNP
jgi:hypothetical protein